MVPPEVPFRAEVGGRVRLVGHARTVQRGRERARGSRRPPARGRRQGRAGACAHGWSAEARAARCHTIDDLRAMARRTVPRPVVRLRRRRGVGRGDRGAQPVRVRRRHAAPEGAGRRLRGGPAHDRAGRGDRAADHRRADRPDRPPAPATARSPSHARHTPRGRSRRSRRWPRTRSRRSREASPGPALVPALRDEGPRARERAARPRGGRGLRGADADRRRAGRGRARARRAQPLQRPAADHASRRSPRAPPTRAGRAGFVAHPRITPANLGWSGSTAATLAAGVNRSFDPRVTWDDLADLRSRWTGPLIIKGVMRADDAVRCVEHGADAIVVSNHGGRQLDGAAASIQALPAIVDAVGDRCEIYLDSGVRRGTDIVKALALGARAVLIGRAADVRARRRGRTGRSPCVRDPRGGAPDRAGPRRLPAGGRREPRRRQLKSPSSGCQLGTPRGALGVLSLGRLQRGHGTSGVVREWRARRWTKSTRTAGEYRDSSLHTLHAGAADPLRRSGRPPAGG